MVGTAGLYGRTAFVDFYLKEIDQLRLHLFLTNGHECFFSFRKRNLFYSICLIESITSYHAFFVVKKTILNYVNRGSGCRVASLDAKKTFDKVYRDAVEYLSDQLDSAPFKIESGVKQDGNL
ncbi:hypothetical protein BpHYR1_023953 [Brachionus plicatilis]|uniref:RNA-directed DNA polymerase from mobile element jockey-like n=1 Tax=Brachionus plicatilis TaxID=10195 RepID=A0A3M7SQ86_BRAPC|nr:hypothetical protein BpHYR1_023953 [Brachionus plicatilis]